MSLNIKIVKQYDLKDCGPACLLSVIRFYGGNIQLERIRLDTKTDKDGTTAFNILYAASKYGFDGAGYYFDKKDISKEKIIFPCIAHVSLNGLDHFIVLYGINKNRLIIMDPSVGKKHITLNDFYDIWTGNLLMIYPKRKIVLIEKNRSLINIFWQFIKKEKKLFLFIFLTNTFLLAFTLLSSYYFKIGLTYSNNYFKIVSISFLIIVLFKCVFNYLKSYLETFLNKNLDSSLMESFLTCLFNLPSKVIESRTVGEIVTRLNELNNIKGLFSELFVSFFLNFILTLITIPILYSFNQTLFLILCLSLIIYLFLGIISGRYIYKRVIQNIELEDEVNTCLVENINCYNSIKHLNVTTSILDKLEKKTSNYIYDKFSFSKFIVFLDNIKNFINDICFFSINTFGFYLILKGQLEIANLIVFNALITFFLDPIKNLIDSLPKYYYLKASFIKINELIGIQEKDEKPIVDIKNYDLQLKNIDFSYNDYKLVLSNYSLNIKHKEKIMIIGPSGCGKSTICKLLSFVETDYKGDIYIGEYNYKDINVESIKKNITYVSQHESLYTDTIRNNIIFYRSVSEELFIKVCKACFVDQIIEDKALRYETFLCLDSNNLSGGEIQRIILARACLNSFNVLILDEALSEVDSCLEKKIINNLKKLFADKTIIYVSHKNYRNLFDRVINIGDIYDKQV